MDILAFTFVDKWQDWEQRGFYSRTSSLARWMAEDERVDHLVVVNVPSMLRPARVNRRVSDPARPLDGPFFSLSQVADRVWTVDHRRLLPLERHRPGLFRMNSRLHDSSLAGFLRRTGELLGLRDVVAWHAGPLTVGLEDPLAALTTYDAVDEWLEHPDMARIRPLIAGRYERIRERADVVFAVSSQLAERFGGGRPAVCVVHNGVDRAQLSAGRGGTPADLAALPRPCVGYVGALQERVDVDLISELARLMPDVSFCLVGPVLSPGHVRPLERIPNVRLLGPRRHDELYDYIRAFDVCVMPHLDTALTRAMDPIKLYEYVACGRPSVVTPVADFARFGDALRAATTAEGFSSHIREALEGRWRVDPERAAAFGELASWQARARRVVDVMQQRLEGRAPYGRRPGSQPERASHA